MPGFGHRVPDSGYGAHYSDGLLISCHSGSVGSFALQNLKHAQHGEVLGFGYRVSGFGHRVSRFVYRASVFSYRASGYSFRGFGVGPLTQAGGPRSRCHLLPLSPGFRFRASRFGHRVSGIVFRGAGSDR